MCTEGAGLAVGSYFVHKLVGNNSFCGDQMLKIAIGVVIGVVISAFLILAFPTQTVEAIHKYLPRTTAAAERINPGASSAPAAPTKPPGQ